MTVSVDTGALEKVIGHALNQTVDNLEPIGGGRNSRVYKVTASDGRLYVAKQYYGKSIEGRDRLKTETDSLRFMWSHGERAVPQPIAEDRANQIALFEFIEGETISVPTREDIDQLVNFLSRLDRLSLHPDSRSLPNASEACFTLSAVIDHIEKRLERFDAVETDSAEHQALRIFLTNRFRPALDTFSTEAKEMARKAGIDFYQPIMDHERVLSPSDTGFHNALRENTGQGRILFFDFEYFGWDDPAKMIADVLLHPNAKLTLHNKKQFMETMFCSFAKTRPLLQARVATIYKLLGLKWITIFLNEFIGSDLARRKFAIEGNLNEEWKDENQILRVQLGRAEELLKSLNDKNNETLYMLRS